MASPGRCCPQHNSSINMRAKGLCNLSTFLVYDGPNGEISRFFFQINHGKSAIELFPSLKQLSIHTSSKYLAAYAQFINARRNAGYPVHLVRLGKGPLATEVAISCEAWEAPWLWGSFRLRLACKYLLNH